MRSLVQSVFGKENSTSGSEEEKKHVFLLLKYPGENTPSTSVEDTAQYLPYKYTPFKD